MRVYVLRIYRVFERCVFYDREEDEWHAKFIYKSVSTIRSNRVIYRLAGHFLGTKIKDISQKSRITWLKIVAENSLAIFFSRKCLEPKKYWSVRKCKAQFYVLRRFKNSKNWWMGISMVIFCEPKLWENCFLKMKIMSQ